MLEQQFLFSPSRFCFVSISCLDSGFRRLLHREESTPLLHFKCMDSFSSFGNSEAPITHSRGQPGSGALGWHLLG